jgi:signal transduction histidine kinase
LSPLAIRCADGKKQRCTDSTKFVKKFRVRTSARGHNQAMGSTRDRLTTGRRTGRTSSPTTGLKEGAFRLIPQGRRQGSWQVGRRNGRQGLTRSQRELERHTAQAIANERRRIAADLHDDLGAKLLMIIHASQDERIAALGRQALDEMRLSVRGLTGRPIELGAAIADWRIEAMARLAAAGIELEWPLLPDDDGQLLAANTMAQATRILREAFNNIMRHSHATQCAVATRVCSRRLSLDIRDNGVGFERVRQQAHACGLGLLNMQRRAREVRGQCLIESSPGQGSHIGLRLPLQMPST